MLNRPLHKVSEFTKLFPFIDECFYINVEGYEKREQQCLDQLKKLKITNPKKIGDKKETECPEGFKYPRYYGASKNHYKIFETIKKEKISISLIVEDDIIITDELLQDGKILNNIIKNLSFDLFYFYMEKWSRKKYRHQTISINNYVNKIPGTLHTHFYLVNHNIIDDLLLKCNPYLSYFKENNEDYRVMDQLLLSRFHDKKIYCTKKNYLRQDENLII
jgi:GR25 family glycosyltransferase involved in LPS biosynthesis